MMHNLRLTIYLSALLLCISCEWVDNTGVQPDSGPSIEPIIRVTEEARTDLNFESLAREYRSPVAVEGWERIGEGRLSECEPVLSSIEAADSLNDACSVTEDNCDMVIVHALAANGEPDNQLISVFPPQLSKPVGVKYRWYLIDGGGESQSHETTFCIEAIDNPPIANNEEFTINLVDQLTVEGAGFDENCDPAGNSDSILANDVDDQHPGHTCLQAELVQPPSFATNDFSGSFTSDGGFSYIADPQRTSPVDAFTYRVFDGTNYSERATVTIVTATDEYTPEAVDDTKRIARNSSQNQIFPMVNDTDPFGSNLTIVAIDRPPNKGGSVSIIQGQSLAYTPAAGFRGNETVYYRIRNVFGLEDSARLVLVVR